MQNHEQQLMTRSHQLTTISHYSSSSLPSPPIGNDAQSSSSNGNNSSSSYTREKVFFGNRVFAPPPPFPTSLEVIKSKLCQQQTNQAGAVKSTLPPYHEIKHSGHALARFSVKSRLTKKWRPTFWITQGRHKIHFFRSKADFDEWAANPYLTTPERNQLVKLTIDFINDVYKAGNSSLKGYRATPIQSKFVKIQQPHKHNRHPDKDNEWRKMASHFLLERWTSSKLPSVLVEIGGTDAGQVGALHIILVEMIKSSGHEYIVPTTTTTTTITTTTSTMNRLRGGKSDTSHHTNYAGSISSVGSNASVWELRSVGSNSAIGRSFSNLSCTSSIPSKDNDGGGGGGGGGPSALSYTDYESEDDRRDDDYQQQQQQQTGWNHYTAASPQGNIMQDDGVRDMAQYSNYTRQERTFSPPVSLQKIGSRIMMRMRSRSPSTRARRFQELQEEEEEDYMQQQQQQQQQQQHPHHSNSANVHNPSKLPYASSSMSNNAQNGQSSSAGMNIHAQVYQPSQPYSSGGPIHSTSSSSPSSVPSTYGIINPTTRNDATHYSPMMEGSSTDRYTKYPSATLEPHPNTKQLDPKNLPPPPPGVRGVSRGVSLLRGLSSAFDGEFFSAVMLDEGNLSSPVSQQRQEKMQYATMEGDPLVESNMVRMNSLNLSDNYQRDEKVLGV